VLLVQIADREGSSGWMGSCLLSLPGNILLSSASQETVPCRLQPLAHHSGTGPLARWEGYRYPLPTCKGDAGRHATLRHSGSAALLPSVVFFLAFSREDVMLQQQILTKTELQAELVSLISSTESLW